MPRTYVDNAMNRSLGRVGMAHGTAVHSRSSGGGSYSSFSSASSSASPRTYVDNSLNRSLGRVGMEHGTAVHSRSSGGGSYSSFSSASSSSSPRKYVDNSLNRSLGRVGMEHGTAVHSRSSSKGESPRAISSSTPRKYVDNSMNRSLGRVGMEHGTAIHSRSSSKGESPRSNLNKSSSSRMYVDNYLNRSLGRVGMPLHSMPVSKNSNSSKMKVQKYLQHVTEDIRNIPHYEEYDCDEETAQEIQEYFARMNVWESIAHEKESQLKTPEKIRPSTLDSYAGHVIQYRDIQLNEKIGHGGFGDIFSALWNGSEVAVKKLRVQRVSRKRLVQFEDELNIFSKLDHKNIVQFYGACVQTPNICIVMELMSGSLFDKLHREEYQFSDRDKSFIIREIANGLNYLHSTGIVHCDIKSTNMLLNVFESEIQVKLTDFGLSLMKNDTETTTSKHVHRGTPRYSAPEVLRGELLSKSEMEKTDIYSYGLIIFEILCEEEPFDGLNENQLRKQVGECGLTPPTEMIHDRNIEELVKRCWLRQAKQRPKMIDILQCLR